MAGFKLRKKKEKTPGIQKRIAAAYVRYSGTLPPAFGSNQDALTAKTVCEGSIEVGVGLMEEARQSGDQYLELAFRNSLIAARDRLNGLDLTLDVEAPTNA